MAPSQGAFSKEFGEQRNLSRQRSPLIPLRPGCPFGPRSPRSPGDPGSVLCRVPVSDAAPSGRRNIKAWQLKNLGSCTAAQSSRILEHQLSKQRYPPPKNPRQGPKVCSNFPTLLAQFTLLLLVTGHSLWSGTGLDSGDVEISKAASATQTPLCLSQEVLLGQKRRRGRAAAVRGCRLQRNMQGVFLAFFLRI